MKFAASIISLATTALVAASPMDTGDVASRGDSGCFTFQAHNCFDGVVCQCSNGWFYLYNQDQNGCQPPWGFLGTDASSIPGWRC